MMGNPIETNPYEEYQTYLTKTLHKIEELNETPLEQALNEFSISIGKEPINLT